MFQKLIEVCTDKQRSRIVEEVAPFMHDIACNTKGTHSLQALIGLISTEKEEVCVVNSLEKNLVKVCKNPNGTHFL